MKNVSTVILAGGRGARIGGDKGLQVLRGRPLLLWVLEAVRGQSDEVLISANDKCAAGAEYASFGYPLIADITPDSAGPLAGLQAALSVARHAWVATVPCDTPFLPDDLLARLLAAAGDAGAAVATVAGKRQPTIALYRKSVLPELNEYLASGERRVGGWLATLQTADAAFDDPGAFINVNTQQELEQLNRHE
jgi:molybdopterin-guanine dinucleotide biosynthesis protein A